MYLPGRIKWSTKHQEYYWLAQKVAHKKKDVLFLQEPLAAETHVPR